MAGTFVGLYFSASWCGACVHCTPELAKVYSAMQLATEKSGKSTSKFEIVFISSDRTEQEFQTYFEQMPWLALPFGHAHSKMLEQHFKVSGIPRLVIVGPDGKIVNSDAAFTAAYDEGGKNFPWRED